MSMKIAKIPESDITARKPDSDEEDDLFDPGNIEGLQMAGKSGKHSAVQKLAASRPEFATGTAAKHKAGAFGKPKPTSPTLHGLPGEVSQKGPKTRKKT
jgi:hypothetical protein